MAEIDVAQALVALEQDDVRREVAGGTFDRLDDAGLTDDERRMVQDAAAELTESEVEGEVEGFGIIAPHIGSPSRVMMAARYAGRGNLGSFSPDFNRYYQRNFGMNSR